MAHDDNTIAPGAANNTMSQAAVDLIAMGSAEPYRALVVQGAGNMEARRRLALVAAPQLVNGPVKDVEAAAGMLSGMWLWHDWLDESHKISQALESSTGSFWHAIMHRREGDFSNSKYWYARAEGHGALARIGPPAAALVHPLPADKLMLRMVANGWDAAAFVDFVREAESSGSPDKRELAVQLQQLEWRVLFDACARMASGK